MGLFGFYILKFEKLDFTLWSLVPLAKPHPPLVWAIMWHVGVLTCLFFFCAKLTLLFSPQISSTKQHGFKAKSTVNPPRIPSFMTTPFWKQLNSQIIQLKTTKPINPYLLKDPMNPCSLKPNPALGSLWTHPTRLD